MLNLKDARECAIRENWTLNCPKPVVSAYTNNDVYVCVDFFSFAREAREQCRIGMS